jgi:serine protease Do
VNIVGADPEADLAVLKIEVSGLVAAPWGDSDALEVGDQVLAVGNPYRLDRTVTAGIISAKGRPGVVGPLLHQEFLQTDAAVNPGNSGGPLVNMDGEVVGINTAIVGHSYRGISFAIPSSVAKKAYESLRTTGKVEPRGWLGVAMDEVDPRRAARLGLDRVLDHLYGVEVVGVVFESPAHAAGLQPGDVILKWNGQEIHSPPELSAAVVRTEVGTEVPVEVFREGRVSEVRIKVGSRTLPLSR